MTAIGAEPLLEASAIAKTYGAVVALKSASLAVRPGEVHALMGANGAGKSTLVKILTGAVRPDSGTISVRGKPRVAHSPADARRGGIVSVYQEPALVPDLDIRSNLRLTETPLHKFRHWLDELGIERLDLGRQVREVPLATQRVIDLARALAIEPDVLMLDEMTAALPANLTEKVLEVIGRQRGGDRSVIFISHRMIEIAAVCDRATVLREGETVGVVDVTPGSEERIVELMLGDIVQSMPATSRAAQERDGAEPRLVVRDLTAGTKLQGVSFELHPGEVLGVVALEGQGQDELFDILAGSDRPSGGELRVDGKPVSFRHPADAIRAGLVYVAADRAEALLPQRSVRENIALPFVTRLRRWGPINLGREGKAVNGAIETLQIDTRAAREVRRLSGGNQQKVTIARWVAGGVRTMLCFDPTRGIDIRTKNQIYVLLRDLAAEGAAVLIYTSELKEIQLVCDRVIVVFGGRVVGELDAADADEPALLRAAYNLKSDALMPEEIAAEVIAEATEAPAPGDRRMSAAAPTVDAIRPGPSTPSLGGAAPQLLDDRAAGVPRRPARVHPADPANLWPDRHPGPGELGPAPGPRGNGTGHRRDLGRDRPLGRLDDGPDERGRGLEHAEPVRSIRHRRRDRRAAARPPARGGERRRDRGHARSRHRRDAGDGLRVGRHRAARPEDAGRRLGAVAE